MVLAYTLKDRDLGKLHKAASVGDVDKLIDLIICQKKDIDKVDRKHRTALHIACAMGHVEVVKFLAEVRADLNLCDGQNRTALMKAVQGQNERCVSVLLENHAEVHIADIDGNTALHLAAHSKSVSIARLLLTQDVNINALNNEGLSALSVAVRADHVEMAELLLKKALMLNTPIILRKIISTDKDGVDHSENVDLQGSEQVLDAVSTIPEPDTSRDKNRDFMAELGLENEESESDFESEDDTFPQEHNEDEIVYEEEISRVKEETALDSNRIHLTEMCLVKNKLLLDSGSDDTKPENNEASKEELPTVKIETEVRKSVTDDLEIDDSWDSFGSDDETECDNNVIEELKQNIIANKMQIERERSMEEFVIEDIDDCDWIPETPDKMNTPVSESGADEPSPNTSTLLSSLQEKIISTDKDGVDHSENVDLQGSEQVLDAVSTIPEPDTSRDKNRDFMAELGLENEESESDFESEDDTFPQEHNEDEIVYEEEISRDKEETAHDSNRMPDHGEEMNPGELLHNRAEMASESDADEPSHDAVSAIPESNTSTEKGRHLTEMCLVKNKLLLDSGSDDTKPENNEASKEELPTVKNETEVRKSVTDDLEIDDSWVSFESDDEMECDNNVIEELKQNIIANTMQIEREKSMEEFVIEDIDDCDWIPETPAKMNTPVSESGADETSPNTSTLLSSLQEKIISTDKDGVDHSENVDLQGSEQVLDAVSTIPEPDTSRDKNRDFMAELGLENEESESDFESEDDTFPQEHNEDEIVYEEEMSRVKEETALDSNRMPDHGEEMNQCELLHNGAEMASESDADEPSHDAVSTIPEPDTSRDTNRDFMFKLGLENAESEPESSQSDYDSKEDLPIVKNEMKVRNSNTDNLEDASARSSASSIEDNLPHVRRTFSPDLLSFTVTPQESLNSCTLPRETEITPRTPHSPEDSDSDIDCPSDNEMMEEVDELSSTSECEPEEEPEVISSTTDVSDDEGRMLKEKENENLFPIKETNTSVTPPLSFNSSPLLPQREMASQKPQSHEDSDTDCPSDNEMMEELYKWKSDNDPMEWGQNDSVSPEPKAARTLASEPEEEPKVISSMTNVSDDEGKMLKEEKENENSEEVEFNFEDLTQASDTTAYELNSAPLFVQKLNLRALDPTNMIQLQNIFREYESTIQQLENKNSDLSDKVNQLEMDNVDLKNSLNEVKEIKTEVVNLKYQLKQEQESQREVTEAYNTTKDKLQRTEEQRQLETRDKQKMEVTLRTKELEMRTVVNNIKQLEDETLKFSETLKLLQTSTLQEQIRNLRGDVERLHANSSLRESHCLKENKTLKEELQEAQREVKANSETAFNYKHQLSTLKSELGIMTNRFENEKQARETLEKELDSTRTRLATAVQEAERCMAAKADAEKCLLRERKERQRLKNRLAADRASHREEVSSLSLKLSKAERENNSLEEEQRRITLQLTEKRLLLDALQEDKERLAGQVEKLDKALESQTELLTNTQLRREAAEEQLAQAQGDAMLLRQQLDEANNKCEVKEKALTDAQREFSDKLSKVRFDCGERVTLVEGKYKKLAKKTADLRDQVLKLEQEKACALKDVDNLKDQYVKAAKRLTETEEELAISVQTLKELQSVSSASTATIKRLEEAVQRLEIKNSTVEEDFKMQLERIKKNAKKISEQKNIVEARLDQEKNKNSELQKEMHSLRASLKTAEERLNDRDMRGETHSSMKNSTVEEDLKKQLERMKKNAKKISEQKTIMEARLDQEKNKNSELQKEMHSLCASLKTAEERLNDRDMRGETHSSMNLDARKAQHLQVLLDRETLLRRQLEKDIIILGGESASLKRSEQCHSCRS
uniref:CCDC144C-like coiled-coil domain-containing protein n=1 Tax=Neogobius melanostomus TaxID=47308 RepID=A0A8C6S5J5_9GOBI